MYVVGAFPYSDKVEVILAELLRIGVSQERMLALPLDKRTAHPQVFDSMHRSDGVSFIELATILGMIFMLLGAIYGFQLRWGPIAWASIGLVVGFVAGFGIDYMFTMRKKKRETNIKTATEVFLMVHCESHETEKVERVMWEYLALGVAKYDGDHRA
ncbi:hypothetical protein MO973_25035 [Paenibacillus sp. TRM 82003]|nr:hypothetical protein [Paenibacillus sp. TRM 82003]MCI3923495.1 hypothetical protein [Paenibacillus sp. TRM 82003]